MTAHWEAKTLGEICTIKPSKAQAKLTIAENDEVSFVPMEDLGIGVKYLRPVRNRRLGDVIGSYTYFADGDVLIAKITPCFENGKLGIARGLTNGVGFGSSEYIVLRPDSLLDAEFLYYYLARPCFLEEGARTMTGEVGHKRVTKEFVESYSIPLPPQSEQRRIVAMLDEAFEGIATAKANAEKNLKNAHELFEAELRALVCEHRDRSWTGCRFADACEIVSKLVDPREFQYQDLPHVGAGNIESNSGALSDVLTARKEQLISGKFLFDDTIVLYSKIRPYLKKVVRPDFSGLCSADIYPLAPKTGRIIRDFLYYLLLTPEFTEYAIKGSARAGMPKVNREHLFAFELSLPTIEDQVRIAEKLDLLADETRRLGGVYERKLSTLDELKKSLLHQAFSGQL